MRSQTRRKTRRGILSMELVLTLPILGMVLFALFEFSMLFFARGHVVDACRAGGRIACLNGATPEAVERTVRRALKPSLRNACQVRVDCGEHTGDWVRVAVSVPMNRTAPDLLWPIGFNLEGRNIYAETRMVKE
ncbi:MAG: pilus assembly protein [Planctomycetaceae bacterium]|nr:pilus assembly protein [Planctomycetaceae bacterium]